MGKNKYRGKKKTKATTAKAAGTKLPPSPIDIDVADINKKSNMCAHCLSDLPTDDWTDQKVIFLDCCGYSICHRCNKKETKKSDDATKQFVKGVVDGFMDDVDLIDLSSNIMNRTCKCCGAPPNNNLAQQVCNIKRLAEAGVTVAQYMLGCRSFKGSQGLVQNTKVAIMWLEKAAGQGSSNAAAALGDKYHLGQGVTVSFVVAAMWYKQVPQNAVAQNGLGHLLRDGKGVPRDIVKAKELFRLSALQDYPPGILDYAELLLEDAGNEEEALKWFKRGSVLEEHLKDYGRPISNCQALVALMVTKMHNRDSMPLALFWARRAAKNGSSRGASLVDTLEPIANRHCANCAKEKPTNRCSGCKVVMYCSKECQLLDWKGSHKHFCKTALPKRLKKLSAKTCAECGKADPQMQCSECAIVCYCSKECGKKNWPEHKKECKFF